MPKIDGRYKIILLITLIVSILLFALTALLTRDIRRDTAFAGEHPLHISEVMSRNMSYANDDGVICDWIELENTGDTAFDLSGYHLSDDYTGAKYAFPVGSIVPAGGYIVVWCSSELQNTGYAPFNLKRQGGEHIVLSNSRNFLIDEVNTIPSRKNCSSIRAEDGSLTVSAKPTPGFPNTEEGYERYLEANGHSSSLRLNEIMVSNSVWADENGRFPDWIELFNGSDREIDAGGYLLSDKEGVSKYRIPDGTRIPAGGFYVVYCDSEGGEGYAPFSLQSYGGEAVTLSAPSGSVIDRVNTERTPSDHSLALCDGSWSICAAPTPGYANTGAGFVSLIAARGAGTAGAVITKVSPRNKTGKTDLSGEVCDWLELTNAGNESVSLLGWYLSDTESEPTRWAILAVTLTPGESITVFCSGGDRKSGELHTDFRLSGDDILLLTSPAGEIVSRVPCVAGDDELLSLADDGSYTLGMGGGSD